MLIVEDDKALASALRHGFSSEGFQVTVAVDGADALERVRHGSPDLVLLDLMLPKLSGFDVLEHLRAGGRRVPVIVLTARGQEIDKVVGLRLGADDYVTKPFGFMELLARAEAVLRRSVAAPSTPETIHLGSATADLRRHEIRRGDRVLSLTPREACLLAYLDRRRGDVVSRAELLDAVWGYKSTFTRTVDTHVAKLRKKIEAQPSRPAVLLTVHRVGYRLVETLDHARGARVRSTADR